MNFLWGEHFPEKVDDIGQAVGIDDQGDGLAEDDDGHVLAKGHLGQGSQAAEKVRRTDGPDHHKDKETLKALALIQPADILVIGALADDGLDKGGTVGAGQIEDQGAADDNADIIIKGADDMPVDKDTSDRGQGAWDDGNDGLQDLQEDKERRSPDAGLFDKGG